MNPSAIYSKSGKGVQEASGKTSLLKRGDRAVLSAIDGRATLTEVAQKVGKSFDGAFEQLIRQLEKDGFVREVAAAAGAATTGSRPVVAPRPAPKAPPPAAKAPAASSGGIGEDLDFTSIMPAVKPGTSVPPRAPATDKAAEQRAKEQESALHKARQEAEARAQAERDRMRLELEAKTRAETEAKIRAETEKKVREEAEARLRAEADAKAKAARDAAVRLAAEAKAKAEAEAAARIEAERKAREEAERKAREEAEKARREAEELRQRLEEERRAREEVERKAREEAERKAREEAERKRKEEEERRRKEEEERRAREEAERKAREEAERKAREEAERQKREAEERKRKEEEERRRIEEEERARAAREEEQRARDEEKRAREEEERAQRAREEEERARKSLEETKIRQPTLAAAPPPPPPPPPPAARDDEAGSLDSLMADLDSFSQREEDERAAREAAERKARDEKKRKAQEESERRAKEEAEHERREAEARRRKQEEERREQEEAERRRREAEEQQRLEAEERKRKAQELLLAAKQAQEAASSESEHTPASAAPTASDDIGVTDDDLDMDDVRKDQAVVAKESRKQQREREREAKKREREARARAKAAAREPEPVKYSPPRRPRKWGKPVAITLFLLLAAGIGALHVMPLPMREYEQAASAALGQPVRIASGRLSLFTGVRLNLEGVRIGDSVRIASVHAYPELGSLLDERKAFNRIELEGMTIAQAALGETLFARLNSNNFSVRRILVKQLKLDGPVPLPTFEAEAALGADGALRSATLRGPEELTVALTPSGKSVEFDGTASSFTLPFAPGVHLSSFAMKGVATTQGMNITAWGGSVLDGALTGTANVRWGGNWHMDGVISIRGINAAVFAPALLSEGKAEGTGKFSMSGAEPAKLANATRIDGSFTVNKGVLGSFDLPRAIQTAGRQYNGRTQFVEMTGQGVYDRGAVALRNVIISAGALSAGASADIAEGGALSGRIVADVKTAGQSLRQTLNLGGTVREPQVRN